MARRKPAGRARSAHPRGPASGAKKPSSGAKKPAGGAKRAAGAARKPPASTNTSPASPPEQPRTFRLGVVPGTTPGKWIDTWHARMPHVALQLVALTVAQQREALESDAVDAALVRLPLDESGLHVIRLYDEVAVVVASADSHLLAADALTAADLADETLIVPGDSAWEGLTVPGTVEPRFPTLAETADAIATVASGVGIVIVPMSLARLHHRKDAEYRRLDDGPLSTVALVWPKERTTADVETFVGIVRGRTTNSSR